MDIALAIDRLVPAADYQGSVTDNTEASFDSIRWNDQRTKPTWAEVTAEWSLNAKVVLIDHLSFYRYQKEVGGISLSGLPVATDDRTKTLLVGAYNDALQENNPNRLRQFKVANNFATINNAALISIALEIAAHVQKCFDSEAATFLLINDDTLTTIEEVEDAFDAAYEAA